MKTIVYRRTSKEVDYLIKQDHQLKQLFDLKDEIIIHLQDDYFFSLAEIIIAQQLSSKVVRVLMNRFKTLFSQRINPQGLLDLSDETLKAVGLSYQKIKYLRSLSTFFIQNEDQVKAIKHLSNEEIVNLLIQVKGIGRWSAEMFLIFSLGREDVFSVLDLGLRNAIKKIYNDQTLSSSDIETISQKWVPYRTVVAHYLWHAWDN